MDTNTCSGNCELYSQDAVNHYFMERTSYLNTSVSTVVMSTGQSETFRRGL